MESNSYRHKVLDIEVSTDEDLCDYVKTLARRNSAELAYCKSHGELLRIGLVVELKRDNVPVINRPFLSDIYCNIGMPKKMSMRTLKN